MPDDDIKICSFLMCEMAKMWTRLIEFMYFWNFEVKISVR